MAFGRPRWLAAALTAFLVVGCFSSRSTPLTPDETAKLQQEITVLEESVLCKQAELEVLEGERKLLESEFLLENPGVRAKDLSSASTILRSIDTKLQASARSRREALEQLESTTAKERDQALERWRKARLADVAADAQLAEVKARFVAEGNADGWEDVWDHYLVGLVVAGALLVGLGFALGFHVERVWVRQRWRSGIVTGLLVALGVAGSSQGASSGELETRRDQLKSQLADLDTRIDQAKKLIAERRKKPLAYWTDLLAAPEDKGAPQAGMKLVQEESKAHDQLRQSLIDHRIVELAATSGLAHVEQAEKARKEVPLVAQRSYRLTFLRISAKLAVCVVFSVAAFIPLALARGRAKRRLSREAVKCPRCDVAGELEKKKSSVPGEALSLRCKKCDHEFRRSYQRLPRLCFPTVGLRSSGKTHWLVTAYDLVRNNNVHLAGPGLEKAPSLADETFDKLVQVVLENHIAPRGTTHALPAPLTFHLRDGDHIGSSCALLNLFDFSGEVMDKRIDMDALRQRALLMDGFVLFLDPTQVIKQGNSLGIDHQIRQLSHFRDEMRDARGLEPGARLRVPVAVCVSKLDLLVNQNPMGGEAKRWLRQLRATASLPLSLETVEKRSKMLANALPNIFPGWNITEALEKSFGNHFLFFPMTPVGIEENELGVTDLTKRNIVPFGIVEPILWLMHMRGYVVL